MDPTAALHADRLPDVLQPLFIARLVGSARGRAFHLNFMVDAEESDEGVFDDLLSRADDPEVQKMVRIHRDDERRHGRLLRECVARGGVPPAPVPDELRYVPRIDRIMGGAIAAFRADKGSGIMEVYAMLQVVEERGVKQFPLVEQALRAVDPESAAVVARVIRDEQRHVKYAQAISRRYAPDQTTLEQLLCYFREVEARAFSESSRAYLRFAVEHDLLATGEPEGLFWRGLVALLDSPEPAGRQAVA